MGQVAGTTVNPVNEVGAKDGKVVQDVNEVLDAPPELDGENAA
jgi:hypothetical protein